MATKSYEKLLKRIESLQLHADKARSKEVAEVVSRIKDAIAVYGLTESDLFPGVLQRGSSKLTPAKKTVRASEKIYSDGKGGLWKGMGKRPRWLADAIASGHNLSDFLVDASSRADMTSDTGDGKSSSTTDRKIGSAAAKKMARTSTKSNATSKVKYADGNGNTWSGRGRKPAWLSNAVASGRPLEDLLA